MKLVKLLVICMSLTFCSCSKSDNDTGPSAAVVRVIFDDGTKTATDLGLVNGLLYIFDDDKTTECIYEINAKSGEYNCSSGGKYICGVFNIFDENLLNRLKSVSNYSELLELDIPFSTQKQEALTCFLTAGGQNNRIDLKGGKTQTVRLSGKSCASKITILSFVNKLDKTTFPGGKSFRIRLDKISLSNIAANTRLVPCADYECLPYPVSIYPGTILERGATSNIPISLCCFPSADCHLCIEGVCDFDSDSAKGFRYNVRIGQTKAGYEYSLGKISIFKAIERDDFAESADIQLGVNKMDWTNGEDLLFDDNCQSYEPQYELCPPEFTNESGYILFDEKGGRNRVSASNSNIVVNGAGRYWELYAAKAGESTLSISNGFKSVEVKVWIYESIK